MRNTLAFILVCILCLSCKNESPTISNDNVVDEPQYVMSDSIMFEIELTAGQSLLLNLEDEFYAHYSLEWKNETERDSVFVTTIPRYHKTQIVDYHYSTRDSITNKFSFNSQDLLIDSLTNTVRLKKEDLKVILANDSRAQDISSMSNAYEDLRVKIFRSKKDDSQFLKPLDSLKRYYDIIYGNQANEMGIKLNALEYYDKLYGIDPSLVPFDSLLRHSNVMIARSAGPSLVYKFLDTNYKDIGFEFLNDNKENEISSRDESAYEINLAIGVLRYLRYKDNKGNNLYPEARNWLKRTAYYKDNRLTIDSQIDQMDPVAFQHLLSNLDLLDINLEQATMAQIIRENPSPYYLIDLWATWCAPCLQGMDVMRKMDFSKNVKVISLSTDYKKDTQLWQTKSVDLDLEVNYLINIKGENSKKFIDFIAMERIPRYLLMDQRLHVIDPAFYHPQEPQFLNKLRDVKNHTRW